MIELATRHLRRHWRINLAVLLCLTLASALLASMSSYTEAMATRELNQSLAQARPAERNLLVTGTRYTFTDELYQQLVELLGPIMKEWLVIRQVSLPADPQATVPETGQKETIARLEIYAFNVLPANVRVVEGRLPASVRLREAEDTWRPPPIEAVIARTAAEQTGYGIGDRLTATKTFHRLDIVGVVEPLDPTSDIWGEDLSAFTPLTDADGVALPLIIDPNSMQSNYPQQPIFWHQVSWRFTLNHQLINVDRAEPLHTDLINFQTQSATQRATTHTALVQMLADYLARMSRVRMALFLLTAQALFFVFYTLTMFTSFMVDRSQVELATLASRGANVWQVTGVFALENLLLALPAALLLGPGLAQVVIRLWSYSTDLPLPTVFPVEAWLLSAVVAALGWLALILPLWLTARRNQRGLQPIAVRPERISAIQQRYLDFYLLAFGGLLYWQLNQSGSFVMRRLGNSQLADPLLLMGPTLLLIAAAMILLRVLPLLLELLARLVTRIRGVMLPLGLFRLARDPQPPGRVVLLVSLTAGLVLFTRIFGDSLAHSQQALPADTLADGIMGALQLNALTLVFFSVAAFFLLYYIAAQERIREFNILRTMGLSAQQWQTLLTSEGVMVLLVGLLFGTLIGLGLATIMTPYLAQALAESLTGGVMEQIVVDLPAIAQLYLLLIAVYGAALCLLWLVLGRTRAPWTRWRGDE